MNKQLYSEEFISELKRIFVVAGFMTVLVLFAIFFSFQNTANTTKQQAFADLFAVTVYAADGNPIVVKPDVMFPIGDYRMTNSRAPGFPMLITAAESDGIQVRVTEGSLLLWNPPDYHVYDKGQKLAIETGDTIYWSPLMDMAEISRITLIAYKNNQEVGTATIEVSSDDAGVYTGKLLESE